MKQTDPFRTISVNFIISHYSITLKVKDHECLLASTGSLHGREITQFTFIRGSFLGFMQGGLLPFLFFHFLSSDTAYY